MTIVKKAEIGIYGISSPHCEPHSALRIYISSMKLPVESAVMGKHSFIPRAAPKSFKSKS
jgi:hypothetical protein